MIPKNKKSLPTRSDKIEAACRRAKKRDGNACLVDPLKSTDRGFAIDAAHILPRNSPFGWYDPADENWIMSLWRPLHQEYDRIKKMDRRIRWLRQKGLWGFADRLEKMWGGI